MINSIVGGSETAWTTTTVVVLGLTVAYWCWFAGRKSSPNKADGEGTPGIPWAPGGLPLLGHALAYRRDPSGFLVRTREACGPVFRLNLAGRQMILVCGPEEQRQLAMLPDSVLSSRKAVAEIGFEQTLGAKNVYEGTQIHKGIVKAIWKADSGDQSPADQQLADWQTAIRSAMEVEADESSNGTVDFLHLVRRVMLRSAVEMYIGRAFLKDWTTYDFLKEFMDFQDTLEDVTAKAAVFPRWLSLPTMLWPLQRKREAMQRTIQHRLDHILKENDGPSDTEGNIGFWLRELLNQGIPIPDIAEFVVGLLFAAHKNPAIGAAQTYLLLREHASDDAMGRCRVEAKELLGTDGGGRKNDATPFTWSRFRSSLPTLRRACLESLRLTAHSIGAVRTAQSDVEVRIAGDDTCYRIPEGATVGFAHITSSLDATLWGGDAASFDASFDRHPEESYNDDFKFTTFSNGTHKCPGRVLAMIKLQVTVALLLTEYDVELPETLPVLDFERATLAQRDGPVLVSITHQRRA